MAFDPDAYVSGGGGFDPSAYVGTTGPSELDSAGRGAAQGASFGLRDEGAGALKSPFGALKEIANKVGADFTDEDIEAYRRERDASRGLDAEAKAANPKSYLAGEIGGGVATSFIPGLGLAKGASLARTAGNAALQGAAYGVGASDAEDAGELAYDTIKGGALGALGGAAGFGLGKALSKGATATGNTIGKTAAPLERSAENLAVKATGATERQSSKFAANAGRELLDGRHVRFGDSPGNIAERLAGSMDEAGEAIGSSLRELDAKGVKASADNVVKGLEDEMMRLSADPSQAGTVRKLRGIIDDIINTGRSEVPVSQAEVTKRGYNKMAGNWMDPEVGAAGKKAYLGYADEVERAATAHSPELGSKFKEAKKTYGLLAPIQEAAERRAATLNQSQFGGLGDAAAYAVAAKDVVTGGSAIAARRLLAPRLASSFAVTADNMAQVAAKAPQMFGKFAPVMQNAAQRGAQSVAATHFILESSNPEYRELVKKMSGGEEQEDEQDY